MAPNPLLVRFSHLFETEGSEGPVLDLACGSGENGLFLAGLGLPVVLADRSAESLGTARKSAEEQGLAAEFWEVDLETGANPLQEEHYRAVLVFRYLHRPLIPSLRRAVRTGGIVIYETFTSEQPKYGKPHSPEFLLQPGELAGWFQDWQIIHQFEGVLQDPPRAVAQIVCRKPGA